MTAAKISFWSAASMAIASAALAAPTSKVTFANLSCGQARLQARTTSVAHPKPADEFFWLAQQITLQNRVTGAEQDVQIEGSPASSSLPSQGGMQAVVSSWKCLHGTQHDVILLWYACERADKGGACQGEREWEVLLDTDGRRLDAGYAHQDPRYEELSKRLGISIDVELESATGD